VVDISEDVIALGKPSLAKLARGKSQNERLWNDRSWRKAAIQRSFDVG
jgi:hypothetical protein